MDCPRDKVAMREQAYWKHPRHQCGQCRGLFLGEEHVIETLGRTAMEGFGERAAGTVSTAIGKVAAALPESPLLCPRDGETMRVFVYKNVELDICPACHSLWLDEGEFAKVRTAGAESHPMGLPRSLRSNPFDAVDPISGGVDVVDFIGEAVGALLEGLGGL
jgi:Zn-finger nucleic acid-binding protein